MGRESNSLRKYSQLWRVILHEKFILLDKNINLLRNQLKDLECSINKVTLRNWLFNENMIGPKNLEHIDIIALLTDNKILIKNINYVKNSIGIVRGFHQKAAFKIRDEFVKNISSVFKNIDYETWSNCESLEFEIDPYGKILLLKIIDIGFEYINIDLNHVNKLILDHE